MVSPEMLRNEKFKWDAKFSESSLQEEIRADLVTTYDYYLKYLSFATWERCCTVKQMWRAS